MNAIRGVAIGLAMLASLAIGAAGILKFLDLAAFERSLMTWRLFSADAVRMGVVLIIPGVEVAAAFAFLSVARARRAAAGVCAVLLSAFAATYLVEALVFGAPDCACWGVLHQYLEMRASGWWVVARNAALIACFAIWRFADREGAPILGGRVRALEVVRSARARGLTLTEVLVVIVILGVIAAVIVPSLFRGRQEARTTASLANAREHARVFAVYAGDYSDHAPYFTRPVPGESTVLEIGEGRVVRVRYFSAFFTWPYVLGMPYYHSRASPAFVSAYTPVAPREAFDYLYPCWYLAHPEYWSKTTRKPPPLQLRATRLADLAVPAHKAFVVDDALWQFSTIEGQPRTIAGCADGHAEVVMADRLTPQHHLGDGAPEPYSDYHGHFGSYNPMLHTLGGARSPDFTR